MWTETLRYIQKIFDVWEDRALPRAPFLRLNPSAPAPGPWACGCTMETIHSLTLAHLALHPAHRLTTYSWMIASPRCVQLLSSCCRRHIAFWGGQKLL